MVKKSFLFTALAATFTALTQTVLADSDVLELTDNSFESQVLNQDLVMVKFFAPWCGHCKALAPEYENAATQLKDTVKLGKIDCTENKDTCIRYGIRSYPTLKVFRKGFPMEYKGARKSNAIVEHMQAEAAPALHELEPSDITDFKTSKPVVIVGYSLDDATKTILAEIAENYRLDFPFGVVNDEALAEKDNVKAPGIVLYKNFDEGRNDFDGEFTIESIETFIKVHSTPDIDDISSRNFKRYVDADVPLAFYFYDNENDFNEAVEIMKPLAKKYKGKMNFVTIDGKRYGAHARNIALRTEKWPAFAIQYFDDSGAKYPLDQTKDVTAEAINALVQDCLDGKLISSLKSADIPAENNRPVKIVVTDQFNEIVLDTSKDVFLQVHSPWCAACTQMEPVWEKLADAASKQDDSIVIAKMDASTNDVTPEAGFKLSTFPTLKFFKAGTNELIDYDGDRTIESFIEFISQHSTKKTNIQLVSEQDNVAKEETTANHDEL